ncbi:hypothetical protein EBZ37_07810 [bacterium]|nr:hypothetical protein [bacterium]
MTKAPLGGGSLDLCSSVRNDVSFFWTHPAPTSDKKESVVCMTRPQEGWVMQIARANRMILLRIDFRK